MDQSVALNALAPYIALAKSATSPRAAADLITQATSAPNTYVFAELLQQPNIQALKSNEEFGAFYTLLEVFAWGTWETYTSTPTLPPLTDTQTLKLRLLSLLTIASSNPSTTNNLSYAMLSARLGLTNTSTSTIDLEHLITQAIYSNLLTATLNPSLQTAAITSVSPLRDLAPGSIKTMIAELDAWSLRCESVLKDLEGEVARVKGAAAERERRELRMEKQVKGVTEVDEKKGGRPEKNTRGRKLGGSGEVDEGEEDEMDVDGVEGAGGKKGAGGIAGFMGRFGGRGGR